MHKKNRMMLVGMMILTLLVAAVGCEPAATETPEPTEAPAAPTAEPEPTDEPMETEQESISVAGSTTVQPLAEKFAEAFNATNPNVQIDVQGGGSSVGVKSAGQGTVDVGMASREVKDSEKEEYPDMVIFTIARDGIAIAAHPDVDVDGLAIDQVRSIFAGEITNWSEVGGSDAEIVVVSREEGSGTRGAFEDMVMGDDALIAANAILFPSNGAVRTALAETPNAIGFLSFGYLDDTTKALEVDGAAPTPGNAASGTYPVVRPLNMMTNGEPTGIVKEWLDFILSEDGQAVVEEEGYISILASGEPAEEEEEEPVAAGQISVAGSTTVQPLAEKFAEAFNATNPDVQINVQGGGSSVGVKSAGQGTVDVGMASREVKDSEKEEYPDMVIFTIARDGIAIAAHPDVDVDGLAIDQVRSIFAGEITNWSEVGGSDAEIIVVSREEGSGTRSAFEDMVMGDDALIAADAILFPSNGAVRTALAETPNAIGFLSFGYLDDTTKALEVDGAAPTPENASNGSYPVVRPLNMMTNGEPAGVVKDWLDFILSDEGQVVVEEEGYIPVSDGGEAASVPTGLSGQIGVAGSTTVQPLAEKFAEAFNGYNPDVQIDVQGGGSSVGVKSAGQGTVDVGMASREVKDSEKEEYPDMVIFTIARDGIAIAAHPDVDVDGLAIDQVRSIFAGEITNWSEVGGSDAEIIVVSREEGSGTRSAFEDMVMGDDALIAANAILFPSNGAVRTALAETPNAIGFLSFGYLDDTTKALEVDGAAPTPDNASNGSYPVVRPLNMMTNGEPTGVVEAWLNFILSAEGQAVVEEEGYIAVQ